MERKASRVRSALVCAAVSLVGVTASGAFTPAAQAAEAKRCGIVCVYAKPGYKGRKICLNRVARTGDIEQSWGKGFVPGSVKVARNGSCSPVAYFFTERRYRGVVAAYFGSAADISSRRYRSFRLKHELLDDD